MLICLSEPDYFRYIRVDPETNRVQLLVPIVAGVEISTDNTCRSAAELTSFFEGGASDELECYKNILKFHLCLLDEDHPLYEGKKQRLEQISLYLDAVVDMRVNYRDVIRYFLASPSNLYSIQLRPEQQDPRSEVVNPVFSLNRCNDSEGVPLSPLYNEMRKVFPSLTLGKRAPRDHLVESVLNALPKNASFKDIQKTLAAQYRVPESFFTVFVDENLRKREIDQAYVDRLMGFRGRTSAIEYVDALLGLCASNLESTLEGSPFYLKSSANRSEKTEQLSILTQFYLAIVNVCCRGRGISDKNFGVILDSQPVLSRELVVCIGDALSHGREVESVVIDFFNRYSQDFNLTRDLTMDDKLAIIQKFETTYRTVTATKENVRMDDFMILYIDTPDGNCIVITWKGLICTDFLNIVPISTLKAIGSNEAMHKASFQYEPVMTVDISAETLMEKLGDLITWDNLPAELIEACSALPVFKVRDFLDDVAKGKQYEANTILEDSEDPQVLLRTRGRLTDYSGRSFDCTAYEYAYWAKDTYMQRMLECYMDDQTKAFLLQKIEEIETSGLAYEQHGVFYRNAHYDTSFILKELSPKEFYQLQKILGGDNPKIRQATVDNYIQISFTATEYQRLKEELEQHKIKGFRAFFYTCWATLISKKLVFDFFSLVTALDRCVTDFNYSSWLSIGKAQRDVPAHIAHEYCRPDRSFWPLPRFNEEMLSRTLHFNNDVTDEEFWFPLEPFYGLGYHFTIVRAGQRTRRSLLPHYGGAFVTLARQQELIDIDLQAVRYLDEVRTADLVQSRQNLSQRANQLGVAS